MATLYAFGAWVMIQAYGPDHVVQTTAADPTGSFNHSLQLFVGKAAVDIVSVLLCTSIFAANLATHNISARYLYSLSVDRVFPAALSRVHSRHDSPHVASLATSVIAVIFLAVVVIAGAEGTAPDSSDATAEPPKPEENALVTGAAVPPKPGRADDFSWTSAN